MDRYIGKRVDGRYELRELIGVGGMANVYKAFDLAENRTVAVKVLRDEYQTNEEFLRRFRNESRAVATLSHPNIVRVYDVSFSQRMNAIVMEFIDGITLKEFIDQRGRLSWKEAVHFTVQVLRALQHAHDNGIVHRDIKPQNIMLLADGTIKVTDFGIARFARSTTRTITDRAIGSVHYISPEQAQGGVIDEKTDIYSVGVMMYEMLTGKLPFDADSPVSVALKQIQLEPTRPTLLNSEIPEGLEAITMRAMQKDPARRYQSAAEMLKDIDDFKHNPSISFAYKYLNEPPRQSGYGTPRPEETRARTRVPSPPPPEDDDEDDDIRPRIPFLSVLTGITVAFVLVSALFVGSMFYFNNPFEEVQEIPTPKLVGEKYSTVKYDSQLIENNIRIFHESNFNDKYDNDVVYEQDPRPGQPVKVGGTIRVKVSAGQKKLTMLDLSHMEAGEAMGLLKDKGVEKNVEQTNLYDDSIPEGYVIRTDPEPNTQIDSTTDVMLYVSMGPENKLISLPDLRGMRVADAKRLLKNFQITITKATSVESEADPGLIVGQYPEAQTQVPQGSSIEVEISGGENAEDMSRRRITVTLPALKQPVTVQALLDGDPVYTDSLTPGVAAGDTEYSRVYDGVGTMTLQIRINGVLYQEYEVNFDKGRHLKTVDNADDFAEGVPDASSVDEGSSSDPEEDGSENPDDSQGSADEDQETPRRRTSSEEPDER